MQLENGVSKKQFLKKWLRVEFNYQKNSKKLLLHIQINIPNVKLSFKGQVAAKTPKGSTKFKLDKKN